MAFNNISKLLSLVFGVYLKAINDTFEALSFSKFKKNKLDVDTFKDLVLEYAMIRGSKFPVSPRISQIRLIFFPNFC
jgi:hypothetical protein